MRIFEHSHVPMVMVDANRRYVEANPPAQLWFRLGVEEMREFAIGDLTPAPRSAKWEQAWARLLDVGHVAGRYQVHGGGGTLLHLFYFGLARVLPGLHLIAFAPADWPARALDALEEGRPDGSGRLTPREIEVLLLAADGLNGPDLAQALSISPATARTHLANIYEKLGVGNRAAAVAVALRLGVIE
jgi:DNA-binding CsgD family transcriptional regulator